MSRRARRLRIELDTLGKAGDFGALAHYADPTYYTKTYRRRRSDVRFYVDEAVRSGGPVLECGVGNGRVALAVARAGVDLVGVDLSAPMLADLTGRLARQPRLARRIELVQGDVRDFDLGRRFPLVVAPFNVVLHLYENRDVERFFATVRRHLAPAGRFVFDFSVPAPGDLCLDPDQRFAAPRFKDALTGAWTRYYERFEYDPLRQLLVTWMEFLPEGGEPFTIPLAQRQFYPQEMAALLDHAGFRVQWLGDFQQAPPSADTDSLVARCRVKRAVAGQGARV